MSQSKSDGSNALDSSHVPYVECLFTSLGYLARNSMFGPIGVWFLEIGKQRGQFLDMSCFVGNKGSKASNVSYGMCAGCWLSGGDNFGHGLCFGHLEVKSMKSGDL